MGVTVICHEGGCTLSVQVLLTVCTVCSMTLMQPTVPQTVYSSQCNHISLESTRYTK
jgi:hypothetical protein